MAKKSRVKPPTRDWAAFHATTVKVLDEVDQADAARRKRDQEAAERVFEAGDRLLPQIQSTDHLSGPKMNRRLRCDTL